MSKRVPTFDRDKARRIRENQHRPLWIIPLLIFLLLIENAEALTNGVALTPPMGFNSWYSYGASVNEALIKSITDTMATNGMLAAGYQYINLDDGWAGYRDTNGVMVADTNKFPGGMKALADYVHAKGFKIGLYTTGGTNTCAGYPGSVNHIYQDAVTYANWGFDYLKYEGCDLSLFEIIPRGEIYIARVTQALAKSGRPMVFSCSIGAFENWMPKYINLWRGTGDIGGDWNIILNHIDIVSQTSAFAGPGQWNDPDVLEVGTGFFTDLEYTSIFSMWCMLASPLITLTAGSTHTNILCNSEAIAVDQDPAGIQGVCVATNGNFQVWRKPFESSNSTTLAVALFNRGADPGNITANWSDLGLPSGVASVRNLWDHAYAGNFTNSYAANIPAHGIQLLKMSYGTAVPLPPAGTNFLSQLPWMAGFTNPVTFPNNFPFQLDLAGPGTPLTLHGVTYPRGLGMISYTHVNYFLGGTAARFQSDIGLDDYAGSLGAVIFRIYADGIKIYDSAVMTTKTATQTIDLDLAGKNVLTLEVTNALPNTINDYADWAGARILVLPLPPPAPVGLSAVATASQFSLSWYATSGATSYNLKRSSTIGGPYATIAGISTAGYIDTNVSTTAIYYYVVSAVNAYGESSDSQEISVSLPCFWTNSSTSTPQNWNMNSNWTNTVDFPNWAGALAIINPGIQSNQTINLDQDITLGSLVIGASNSSASYTIAGNGGSLTFDNGPNSATLTELATGAGDAVSTPLTLHGNLIVSNLSTNLLLFFGAISGSGSLTLSGPGPLLLAGSNSFSGTVAIGKGTLKIGSAYALGTTDSATTINDGGTLDLGGFSASTEPIIVSGGGFDGNGAIVNTAATLETNILQFVTLAGNTTFGGTARWDIRGTNPAAPATLNTGGNAFNLTKAGTNQISLAAVNIDSTLGDINVLGGILSFESATASMGDPTKTLTVQTGATLSFADTVTPWNKQFLFNGDGFTPTLISLEGTNTVIGPMTVNGPCIFAVSNGNLILNGPIDGTGSFTKTLSGWLGLGGTNSYYGNLTITAGTLAILNSASASTCSKLEVSNGALLDVTALNPGFTLGAGQTLSGSGAIRGNLTVGSGATLAPANSNGILTFSNALTLANSGTCVLATNDLVRVLGTLTYGGKLVITNSTNDAFAVGDTIKLFDAASYSGGFTGIHPQIPGPSLAWDTSSLATNGTLRVITGITPHFTTIIPQGGNLLVTGAGGQAGSQYYILTSTNLTLPLGLWTRIATNQFDAAGNFSFTNTLDLQAATTFYCVRLP